MTTYSGAQRTKGLALWGAVGSLGVAGGVLFGGDFFGGADGFVLRQAGYSIADILAKAAFGLLIFQVARIKSRIDDPATYDDELAGPAVGRLNGSGTVVQRPIAA